ncbi:MAG: class I SAM-dependent RNA methyltransferase [Hyphomicrobiaceae bacterium]
MADDGTIRIDRLGARGDGIAETSDGPRYVLGALPGEDYRDAPGSAPVLCGPVSPERIAPICPHFGTCGGCVAQHMAPELYARWKLDILRQAFAHRGIAVEPEPLRIVPAGTRRRAAFSIRRGEHGVALGFMAHDNVTLVDIAACPVLDPRIAAMLPRLKRLAGLALAGGKAARLTVTATATGLDLVLDGVRAPPDASGRQALAGAAAAAKAARLVIAGEEIVTLAEPSLDVGGYAVPMPPGAFCQASEIAERWMQEIAAAAVGKARQIGDLFAGLGTFTLPLARSARVLAVDSDQSLLDALGRASRHARGLKPISTLRRDLFRDPLSAKELARFDAVVIDPPRAGAKAQMPPLAASGVATIVAVSCNPATLARDVHTLLDGGYQIERLVAIDQFLFAAHVEAICVLTRRR